MTNPNLIILILSVPLVAGVITAFASDLVHQAEEVSDKTINYTQQMNDALDCAFKGIELSVCSPNLVDVTYDADMEQFQKTLEEIKKEANATIKKIEEKNKH